MSVGRRILSADENHLLNNKRKMPKQKPGNSKQDYGTPWEFIRAVEKRFGKLDIDLAGTEKNKKAPKVITPKQDSLTQSWDRQPPNAGNSWLNPPFADIRPWACGCAAARLLGGSRILFLTPASVGANWFRDHVFGKALVLFLSPRLSFDGVAPYPKDLLLSVFGSPPGFECWRWR